MIAATGLSVASKPNIVFIMADDLGWADVGYHGSEIETPHIDWLTKNGTRLSQHYVTPMCTPSRVSLLTGRYPSRFGDRAIKPSNDQVLPFGTVTLASALKDDSYRYYAAFTSHMDEGIGKVIDALRRSGRLENTIIVFTSDNGSFPSWKPCGSYPGEYRPMKKLGSNLPYRGYKAQLYEGGIRAPTLVYWPGVLEGGKQIDAAVSIVDWMPTLCDSVGYKSERDLHWDGRNKDHSLVPLRFLRLPYDWSGQNLFDHFSVHVGEAEVAALILECEVFVVDA